MKSPGGFGPERLCCVLAGASSVRTSDISTSFFFPVVSSFSGGDWGRCLPNFLLGGVENFIEAAPEHALAVERHFTLRPQALVGHNRLPGFVAPGLIGPLDEGEDDAFSILRLHRAVEVGDLAFGHVIAERFDHAGRAVLAESLRHLGGEIAIRLALALGNWHDESIHIAAARASFLDDRVEPAKDHALAVE